MWGKLLIIWCNNGIFNASISPETAHIDIYKKTCGFYGGQRAYLNAVSRCFANKFIHRRNLMAFIWKQYQVLLWIALFEKILHGFFFLVARSCVALFSIELCNLFDMQKPHYVCQQPFYAFKCMISFWMSWI